MPSNAEVKSASYFGPRTGTTPSGLGPGNNTIRRPTATTNTSEALATGTGADNVTKVLWAGKFVDVRNEDLVNPVEYSFSVGAQTLVYGQAATLAAGSAAAGWRLGPGEKESVIVPPDCTHVNWIQPGSVSASTIAFRCSEGEVGAK